MYYLQSRYYNPEWGRFVNADGIIGKTGELLGHNMFAYCKSNPVNREDSGGFCSEPTVLRTPMEALELLFDGAAYLFQGAEAVIDSYKEDPFANAWGKGWAAGQGYILSGAEGNTFKTRIYNSIKSTAGIYSGKPNVTASVVTGVAAWSGEILTFTRGFLKGTKKNKKEVEVNFMIKVVIPMLERWTTPPKWLK